MKEQDIQKKIVRFLESKGAYVVKVVAASKSGVPDLLVCYRGHFIGIEVKTPKTKTNVSKLQEYNLETITESGGLSLVAWEVSQVEDMLNYIEGKENDAS